MNRHKTSLQRLLTALLLLPLATLAACGGGSSEKAEPEAEAQDAVWDEFEWDDAEWS